MRADLKRLKRETETGRTAVADRRRLPQPGPQPAAAAAPTRRAAPARAASIGAPLVTAAAIGGVAPVAVAADAGADRARHRRPRRLPQSHRRHDVRRHARAKRSRVQLRQSPFLNLLPEQQVQATLRLMGRDADGAVTPEIAREVCQRTRRKAMLGGTHRQPRHRATSSRCARRTASTATTLAEEQVQAASKEASDHARSARRRRASARRSASRWRRCSATTASIEEATTPSLEALKAYSQGMTDAAHAGRLRFACRSSAAPSSSIRTSRSRTRGSARCCRISANATKRRRPPRAPTSCATR